MLHHPPRVLIGSILHILRTDSGFSTRRLNPAEGGFSERGW